MQTDSFSHESGLQNSHMKRWSDESPWSGQVVAVTVLKWTLSRIEATEKNLFPLISISRCLLLRVSNCSSVLSEAAYVLVAIGYRVLVALILRLFWSFWWQSLLIIFSLLDNMVDGVLFIFVFSAFLHQRFPQQQRSLDSSQIRLSRIWLAGESWQASEAAITSYLPPNARDREDLCEQNNNREATEGIREKHWQSRKYTHHMGYGMNNMAEGCFYAKEVMDW